MAVYGALPFFATAVTSLAGGIGRTRRIRAGAAAGALRRRVAVIGLLICGLMLLASALAPTGPAMVYLVIAFIGIGLFTCNVWAITQTLAGKGSRRDLDGLAECRWQHGRGDRADRHGLERQRGRLVSTGVFHRGGDGRSRRLSCTASPWGRVDVFSILRPCWLRAQARAPESRIPDGPAFPPPETERFIPSASQAVKQKLPSGPRRRANAGFSPAPGTPSCSLRRRW